MKDEVKQAIGRVLNYGWAEELADFVGHVLSGGDPKVHIFYDLVTVEQAFGTAENSSWSAREWVESWMDGDTSGLEELGEVWPAD